MEDRTVREKFDEDIKPVVMDVVGAVVIILSVAFGFEAAGFEAQVSDLLEVGSAAVGALLMAYYDIKKFVKNLRDRF
jgi:uncharacterized membrane protein YqgA involved in biofilm formation